MTESTAFPLSLLFTVLALIFVLVLAWLAIKLLSKTTVSQFKGGRIQVIESRGVGTRERLVLVHYKQREILLGVTAGGISVIDNSPADSQTESVNP